MHPGAQELLYVMEGDLVLEVEGKGTNAFACVQLAQTSYPVGTATDYYGLPCPRLRQRDP
jgi:hypothetical protein